MAIHILRPVLVGSLVLMMSAACQRERSDDKTSPLRETTSDLENDKEESIERKHVTGKDEDPSSMDTTGAQNAPAPALREPTSDLENKKEVQRERKHVTGKDHKGTAVELEPGAGGTTGSERAQ
jgi:hypothetical protein